MIGTILGGRYRIDRLLGAGAMGAVYEAEHTATGRKVAVKVISSGDMNRDKKLVARFQREARAAGAIETEHITQVLDSGEDEAGTPYLVMEMLQGEDLAHTIKRLGPLAPELALRVAAQACVGLQKAHDANVVHRDIKPANLFLAKRDAGEILVKLLDFGIAKVKMDAANDAEGVALTKTGSMLGSPLYMSPEQAKGLKTIDHRADLWSLGVVLYQALTGHTPYDHCDALGGLIIAICHEDVAPVQEQAPWVPPEVAAIVHQCLQRDPAARFQTAAELLAALRALLPGGTRLSEEMFLPLSSAAKASVALKMAPTPSVRPPAGPSVRPPAMPSLRPPSMPSIPPPSPTGVPATAALAASTGSGTGGGALSQSGAGASSASSTGAGAAAPASPSRAPLIASVAALVVAMGAGGLVLSRGREPTPVPGPALTSTVTAVPSAVPTPSAPTAAPSATAAPTATAREVDITPRRVKVVIMPSDALVEVDGARVPVRSGVAEISGVLTSVHRVRVFKGRQETTAEVTITGDGPSPPKVELGKK